MTESRAPSPSGDAAPRTRQRISIAEAISREITVLDEASGDAARVLPDVATDAMVAAMVEATPIRFFGNQDRSRDLLQDGLTTADLRRMWAAAVRSWRQPSPFDRPSRVLPKEPSEALRDVLNAARKLRDLWHAGPSSYVDSLAYAVVTAIREHDAVDAVQPSPSPACTKCRGAGAIQYRNAQPAVTCDACGGSGRRE